MIDASDCAVCLAPTYPPPEQPSHFASPNDWFRFDFYRRGASFEAGQGRVLLRAIGYQPSPGDRKVAVSLPFVFEVTEAKKLRDQLTAAIASAEAENG